MTDQAEHSPLPWRAYLYSDTQRWGVESNPSGLMVCNCGPDGNTYAAGNAALIVHAVNSHEALVEALEAFVSWREATENMPHAAVYGPDEAFLEWSEEMDRMEDDAFVKTRAALAAAKGEPNEH